MRKRTPAPQKDGRLCNLSGKPLFVAEGPVVRSLHLMQQNGITHAFFSNRRACPRCKQGPILLIIRHASGTAKILCDCCGHAETVILREAEARRQVLAAASQR